MVPTFRRLDFRHSEKQESSQFFLGDTADGLDILHYLEPGMYKTWYIVGLTTTSTGALRISKTINRIWNYFQAAQLEGPKQRSCYFVGSTLNKMCSD